MNENISIQIEDALQFLGDRFTSYQFNDTMEELGYERIDRPHYFLKNYANLEGLKSKTWIKKGSKKTVYNELSDEYFFREAVRFLKEKGYKILKPVTKWEEVEV
jgi:hypothetical protein